mgnify:FL=1
MVEATPDTAAEEHEMFTARMPADLMAELRVLARENDRSLSAEARLALRAWLAQEGQA